MTGSGKIPVYEASTYEEVVEAIRAHGDSDGSVTIHLTQPIVVPDYAVISAPRGIIFTGMGFELGSHSGLDLRGSIIFDPAEQEP